MHEGPQGIAPRFGNTQPLLEGMVLSNEPGYGEAGPPLSRILKNLRNLSPLRYYEPGQFGVRLENLLVVVPARAAPAAGFSSLLGGKRFLRFERLTHIPFDKKCVDAALLRADELDWLDQYHADVARQPAARPAASEDAAALAWLERARADRARRARRAPSAPTSSRPRRIERPAARPPPAL